MYFGVQMYGVSKEWKQDPEGFLKKIYEAGYRQIEPCLGFRVDARDYGFWIPEDLEQAMPLLAKYHIEVHAVHIFLDEYHYERELAILTELAQKYHISWFVVKSPARLTKDVLDETAMRSTKTMWSRLIPVSACSATMTTFRHRTTSCWR